MICTRYGKTGKHDRGKMRMENKPELTLEEIEMIRGVIKEWFDEYRGTAKHVIIESIIGNEGYDYLVSCRIRCEDNQEEYEQLGINRTDAGGFVVPME
jgi:hypothetical protein